MRSSDKKPTMRKRTSVQDTRSVRSLSRTGFGQDHKMANTQGLNVGQLLDRRFLPVVAGVLVVLLVGIGLAVGLPGRGGQGAASSAQEGSDALLQDGEQQQDAAGGAGDTNTPANYTVSFTTTGDLIFWREVADYIDANGGASAMAGIADLLDDADVTISNLESPLSNNDSEPVPDKDVYIIGRPQAIEGMKNSGIDIVSLANNHIMDYTAPALQDTLDALDEAGILYAGAGMNEAAADAVLETEVNGARIAFISWTDIVPDYFIAYDDEPGVASARLNMDAALERIREAKTTNDIVIVAMHWGVEYSDYIYESEQQVPAHQMVDAGADIILGNHPHVLQGIEFYKGALISYAHGNCVFRQSFDFGNTHESYVMHFDVSPDGISNVRVIPLYLSDEYGIPSVAEGEQAQVILDRLVQISEGMNTAFDIQGDIAYVSPLGAAVDGPDSADEPDSVEESAENDA